MKLVGSAALVVLSSHLANANVYLHSPRGSNNRLNERSAVVKTKNRLFESNNNDRGGYNVGDKTDTPFRNAQGQFAMKYFMSGQDSSGNVSGKSKLTVEWTNLLGCGVDEDGDKINDCQFLIQTMCQDEVTAKGAEQVEAEPDSWTLRNGISTRRMDFHSEGELGESRDDKNERRVRSTDVNKGLHESWEFFDRCDGGDAIEGSSKKERSGMECDRERQTQFYDKVSPWNDVAFLTDNLTDCAGLNVEHSNHRVFYECVEFYDKGNRKHRSRHLNQNECLDSGGEWLGFYKVGDVDKSVETPADCLSKNGGDKTYVWGRPMDWEALSKDELTTEKCIILPPKTQCIKAPNTRGNYLGNVDGSHDTPRFEWILPNHLVEKRCTMRIRYFVASVDDEQITRENDDLMIGGDIIKLAVAEESTVKNVVVFEDRSHVFHLVPRTDDISQDLDIENIVVRGKRGNIVQTYPAVEYDFVPNRLSVTEGTAVHLQWAGSNTHNNGNPAGDGQAGDAGEGRAGSDRHNFMPMLDRTLNFPMPGHNQTIFHDAEWVWSSHNKGEAGNKGFNLGVSLATAGYYQCKTEQECGNGGFAGKRTINDRMDNAPASYAGDMFIPPLGEWHYKCLRNDNFSNRSQKGTIKVVSKTEAAAAPAVADFGFDSFRAKRSLRTSGGRPNC